ncbi:MAG: HAD family phosphatase [Lachnospiraceae bacterium]|nr:HAD family phosphatase [Lachnospiraceae bacterium]
MGIKIENIEAALFDLDGTLADSMWMWGDIDEEMLRKRGIPYDKNLQAEIEGLSYDETVVYMKDKYNFRESIEEIKEEIHLLAIDKYEYEVTYKPGALEFLKECRKCGIKCGMSTSNSQELLDACERNLRFMQYFDSVRTTNEVERSKPFPDCYLLNAEDLGVKPEKCVVFEDIIPGIQAGLSAGMRVIAVKDKYSIPVEEEKKKISHGFIEDFRELII